MTQPGSPRMGLATARARDDVELFAPPRSAISSDRTLVSRESKPGLRSRMPRTTDASTGSNGFAFGSTSGRGPQTPSHVNATIGSSSEVTDSAIAPFPYGATSLDVVTSAVSGVTACPAEGAWRW